MHCHVNAKLSYMFRCLLRHLQGEIYCMFKTFVTFVYYRVDNNASVSLCKRVVLVY